MYAAYFGLKQEPFSIAPDPRLLFMSEQHREALAHLLYGVRGGGGFVLLTGEIGTGKTTVCRSFLDQVPGNVNLAYIFNPKLSVTELLETVCHEFHIAAPASGRGVGTVKDYVDALNAFLLDAHAHGRNNVLVIDEAQNLSADVLEQLRLLTNLETSERKLLQVILIGQPELREMIARGGLEQLAQRVIARYHLRALGQGETAQYIRHRMDACGLERPLPFDAGALRRVHKLTGGVPRRINLLCDRALLGAFATGQPVVTKKIVEQAAKEVFDASRKQESPWRKPAFALGLGLAMGVGLLAAATRGIEGGEARNARNAGGVAPANAVAGAPAPAPVVHTTLTSTPEPLPRQAREKEPQVVQLLGDEKQAWRELAQAWNLPPFEGDVCDAAKKSDVQCFSRKLPLPLIRQLDRPGIVTLDVGTAKPSYALLVALNETEATLRANGAEHAITLSALAERWQGDFATLWRTPPGYTTKSTPQSTQWIAEQLAAIKTKGGDAPATASRPIKSGLLAFQVAQGLPADGLPGPMTYMQLNRAAGIDEPRLAKAR